MASKYNNYSETAFFNDNTIMTVQELSEYLCIGKNKAYFLLKNGTIKGFRIGSVWRISKEAVYQYIREKSGLE